MEQLPEYMIPTYFVPLDRIPLTPNGKVDIDALPAPGTITGEKGTRLIPPGNPVEEELVEIWGSVLKIDKKTIGIEANFFELGGHSLSAAIMAAKVHKTLSVKLPLSQIFQQPTIQGLAKYIKGSEENRYASIQPVEKKEYYPAASAQKRMFLLKQLKGNDISDNTPEVYMVEGILDKKRLEKVAHMLIERHEPLRTSFQLLDDIPIQRIHQTVDFAIDHYDLEDCPGTRDSASEPEVKKIIKNFIHPFDLAKAPILRVTLVRLSEKKHILMYDFHHIIRDGISTIIFIKEFINLYEGQTLSYLRIQYKDFSQWQNNLQQSGILKRQEEYWRECFPGEIPLLDMPVDYPRPPAQSFEGDYIVFEFNRDLTEKIRQIMREIEVTLYMVLLAIYNILLCKYSGQEDIIVGTPIAGRPHPDLENLMGMFVNTLAIRNYPKSDKTFAQFLNEVKNNTLKAYENQDYQFDDLVNRLKIKQDFSRHPLFDTMLVGQNIQDLEIETGATATLIEGLSFKPYSFEEKMTQFDIIIHALESDQSISFKLRYCTKLFKPGTIKNLSRDLTEIANCAFNDRHIKIKDIKISHGLYGKKLNIPGQLDFKF